MVDIHSHLLPSLDDGPSTLFESLELLRLASKNGTKKIALTPHLYNPRIGYLDVGKIRSAFENFKKQAEEIDIELFLGSEVFCSQLFLRTIHEKNFLTINNSEYLLVEFYFDDDVGRVLFALDVIADAGYRPIVAHPERYFFLKENPSAVHQIVANGALLQVNQTSLLEKNGLETYEFAMWLLANKFVSFVASDAHEMQYRTTNLQHAFTKVYSELSKEYAENLFYNNPEAIISGKKINTRW